MESNKKEARRKQVGSKSETTKKQEEGIEKKQEEGSTKKEARRGEQEGESKKETRRKK